MNWAYVLIAIFAAFFGWVWWTNRTRSAEICSLADSCGFQYRGEALPSSLPLAGPFEAVTSCWNVIDRETLRTRVVTFDCRFGQGKGSWQRTIIAVRGDPDVFMIASFDAGMSKEQIGN